MRAWLFNLRQSDSPEIGNQAKVSEILTGKRAINLRQARAGDTVWSGGRGVCGIAYEHCPTDVLPSSIGTVSNSIRLKQCGHYRLIPRISIGTALTETTNFPSPAKAGAQYCDGSKGGKLDTGLRR